MRTRSTVGRQRALTQDEVNLVLEWHNAWTAQRKALKTLRQLAKELGVAPSTAYDVVRRRGEFKKTPREPVT